MKLTVNLNDFNEALKVISGFNSDNFHDTLDVKIEGKDFILKYFLQRGKSNSEPTGFKNYLCTDLGDEFIYTYSSLTLEVFDDENNWTLERETKNINIKEFEEFYLKNKKEKL